LPKTEFEWEESDESNTSDENDVNNTSQENWLT
jgi:hypothetical protein